MDVGEPTLGYAVADPTGTIVAISPAYAAVLGRHVSECVGRDVRSFMPADFGDGGSDCLEEVLARGRSVVTQAECVLPDGSSLSMSVSLVLVRNCEGEIDSVVIVPQPATVLPTRRIACGVLMRNEQGALRGTEA